jgi:hypothetical protein
MPAVSLTDEGLIFESAYQKIKCLLMKLLGSNILW